MDKRLHIDDIVLYADSILINVSGIMQGHVLYTLFYNYGFAIA